MGTLDSLPEPSGSPDPVMDPEAGGSAGGAGPSVGGVLAQLGELGLVLAVAGGAAFMIAGTFMARPTHGATRSAQLVWQQRDAEIEQAITEAGQPATTDEAEPAGGAQ